MTDRIERRDQGAIVRLVVAVGGCLLALAWLWAARAGAVSDGTVVDLESGSWRPDGVVVTVAAGAGNPLRAGDLVISVNGRPLADGVLAAEELRIGDVVTYGVVRDGERISVPVTLTHRPFWDLVIRQWFTWPYITLLIVLSCVAVVRRSPDPAARAMYGIAVLHIVGFAADWYGMQVIEVATGRLWPTLVAQIANAVLWACALHFAVSFPRPWPALRRRPALIGIVYAMPFLAYGVWLLVHVPGERGLRRIPALLGVPAAAARIFPLLIIAALVISYRLTRDPVERTRMRLVTYSIMLLAASYLLLGGLPGLFFGQALPGYQYYVALSAIPAQLVYGAAVLRYRLWDVQVMLRRSLVYWVVTAGLLAVYLGLAAVLAPALGLSLGLGTVLLVMVVALSFSAARTAVRRAVSRVIFGEREDPYEVLRQLGRRLESASSAEAVLNQLVSTLVRTLRLAHAAIEVPGLHLARASHGVAGSTATSVELVHEGEPIGRLVLDAGPDREPFGAADRRLLDGLAQQVSATAHSLLLAARLQRSLEETVTVLEDERRRLRREIHDSLGPTIASASIRLDVGRLLMRTDPDAAEQIFAELAQVNKSLVGDIRRLVDGLRPTILDSLGLEAALREFIAGLGGRLRTSLHCDLHGESLPAAVEVAAYRIVSEAVTNVVRHAAAQTCDIQVWLADGLQIEVCDDGRGMRAGSRPGMGLTSMRERCAELGGRVELRSRAPQGTVVRCQLPLNTVTAR